MRVHVAFTPAEAAAAPTGIVVDVLRATSTIAQAAAAGYGRILCCAEIEDAKALREREGVGVLAGERGCARVPGFELGNSPSEFTESRGSTLILSTTNGTRAIVAAASRCERVLAASLLNLEAAASALDEEGEDVAILCAGIEGAFALDDAYCAGRLAELLAGKRSDAAEAAVRLARSFADPEAALRASQSARNLNGSGLAADVAWCARESVLDVVPRLRALDELAAELSS